jgi:hypothetical protein
MAMSREDKKLNCDQDAGKVPFSWLLYSSICSTLAKEFHDEGRGPVMRLADRYKYRKLLMPLHEVGRVPLMLFADNIKSVRLDIADHSEGSVPLRPQPNIRKVLSCVIEDHKLGRVPRRFGLPPSSRVTSPVIFHHKSGSVPSKPFPNRLIDATSVPLHVTPTHTDVAQSPPTEFCQPEEFNHAGPPVASKNAMRRATRCWQPHMPPPSTDEVPHNNSKANSSGAEERRALHCEKIISSQCQSQVRSSDGRSASPFKDNTKLNSTEMWRPRIQNNKISRQLRNRTSFTVTRQRFMYFFLIKSASPSKRARNMET